MIKVGKNLGETLRQGRRCRDISQEQLAEAMNVTRQTISNWETGSVVPPMGKLERLSMELDIPLEELLGVEAQAAQAPEAKESEPKEPKAVAGPGRARTQAQAVAGGPHLCWGDVRPGDRDHFYNRVLFCQA